MTAPPQAVEAVGAGGTLANRKAIRASGTPAHSSGHRSWAHVWAVLSGLPISQEKMEIGILWETSTSAC